MTMGREILATHPPLPAPLDPQPCMPAAAPYGASTETRQGPPLRRSAVPCSRAWHLARGQGEERRHHSPLSSWGRLWGAGTPLILRQTFQDKGLGQVGGEGVGPPGLPLWGANPSPPPEATQFPLVPHALGLFCCLLCPFYTM